MSHYGTKHKHIIRLANVGQIRCVLTFILALAIISPIKITAAKASTHYIIAFDQSVGKYHTDYLSSSKTLGTLGLALKEAGYNEDTDHVSIVGYSMEMGQPSIQRFVRPYISSSGDTIIWASLPNGDLSSLFRNWPQGQPLLNPYGSPYGSMQSMAKPYIVMETKDSSNGDKFADKTILLLVSDEVVNGTDDNYSQEWNNVSTSQGADYHKFRELSQEVFSTMQGFNEEFKFVQIELGDDYKKRFPISSDGVYKVIPYEVIAADKPSIHSATDFPSSLPLRRVRGGFKMLVKSSSVNDKYCINAIKISDKRGKTLGLSYNGEMDFTISSDDIYTGDTLIVSLSLAMKDGYYNGTLISENNPRYKDGMTSKQIVKIQDEAKVLGLMPLADIFWWWFPNDVFTAVMIWDLIILLIVIVIVGYILYRCFVRINAYKPSNDKLKITKV